MENQTKYHIILDALQELLLDRNIQCISVSDIAKKAGIGKGSIYYYFPSKDAIVNALVERNYEKTLETAKELAKQSDISPFTRMAMIFQACRSSSLNFSKHRNETSDDIQEQAYIHQKYLKYIIAELKPSSSEIIQQGIDNGDIQFDYPDELAEIVLIILAVKFDNTLAPSTPEKIEKTIRALISLLEKGTENPIGSLDFLRAF